MMKMNQPEIKPIIDKAKILVEALPYIQKFNGKTVVIKYGGNAMINETLKQQVMEDIVLLWLIGVKIVLIHGGGPEISERRRPGYFKGSEKIRHRKRIYQRLARDR